MHKEFSVIIAENDDGHYSLIRRTLYRLGFRSRVIRFRDGWDVLDFLLERGNGPHRTASRQYLVVLDLRLRTTGGIEVLRRLRGHKELRSIPVVILSGVDDEQVIERCRRLGCADYVVKATDGAEFVRVVAQVAICLLAAVVDKRFRNTGVSCETARH